MSDQYYLPGENFCVVVLSYDGAQDQIDATMAEHMAWLTKAYDDGVALMSGRRTPWTGGVMVVRGDKDATDALVAQSPWVAKGLASAEVIGFTTGMAAPAIRDALR